MSIEGVSRGVQADYAIAEFKPENIGNNGSAKTAEAADAKTRDELTPKAVKNLSDKLNMVLGDFGVHAEYSVHEKLNDIMIKIVDDKTGDVISEIPPKKILDMIAKFCELAGIIVNKKA